MIKGFVQYQQNGGTKFFIEKLQNGQKNGENRTNMNIILLILADKIGTTPVHITYPPLISVLIFAMFLEICIHVVGENVFLQFIAVKIPWQSLYKNEKTAKRKRGRESLATCLRNEVLTRPSGCPRTSRLLPPARVFQRRLWFQIFFLQCCTRYSSTTLFR